MDYCQGGNLSNLLKEYRGGLPMVLAKKIAKELATALKTIHSLGLLHRDLKPDNILLTSKTATTMSVKLCDFGLARRIRSDSDLMSQYIASTLYLPFENFGHIISTSYDMWSYGVICYHMAFGFHPRELPDSNEVPAQFMRLRQQGKFTIPGTHNCELGLLNIIKGCLNPTPEMRLTADQVLADSWFIDK